MSETKTITYNFGGLLFVLFIGIKLAGHSFAAWSWWWLLLPIVPFIGLLVRHFGL